MSAAAFSLLRFSDGAMTVVSVCMLVITRQFEISLDVQLGVIPIAVHKFARAFASSKMEE